MTLSNFTRSAGLVGTWAVLALAGCSGGVSAPPETVTPGPLSLTPSTATVYSDLPTTFVVTGGTGQYFITSSDQNVVPPVGSFQGSTFTIVPGSVAVDTPVTLTVRDSSTTTPVTAALVVKPRTVSNVVTITPTASQSAACGTSICAGGDAEVKVTLTLGGAPLRNRDVRFDVVSGEFRIITSAPGLPESLSLTGSTVTDESGTARIRVRALADASAQTGLIQIVDVTSGSFTRASVSIAPSSNAPLNAQPNRITFIGPNAQTCASGIPADVIVFGGRPPYLISRPGSFDIDREIVTASGGRFTVRANGQCTPGQPIAIVDASGNTVTVTASNDRAAANVTGTPLVVAPAVVTLDACQSIANVAVSGGRGPGNYFAAAGSGAIKATVNQDTGNPLVFIQRAVPSPAAATPILVGVSDGQSTVTVTVNLAGAGAGPCP